MLSDMLCRSASDSGCQYCQCDHSQSQSQKAYYGCLRGGRGVDYYSAQGHDRHQPGALPVAELALYAKLGNEGPGFTTWCPVVMVYHTHPNLFDHAVPSRLRPFKEMLRRAKTLPVGLSRR